MGARAVRLQNPILIDQRRLLKASRPPNLGARKRAQPLAMATTSRSVSPGAALLRASRLFSMPQPLPTPTDHSQATKHKSNTATAPYPTHLSITTPYTSRLVGDWGFKRPLPLKTTLKTTIPLVRVKKVDSIEQVTDFQSASDHTITLEKFQEMNLSMSVPVPKNSSESGKVPRSVFEEDGDVTAIPKSQLAKTETVRWKFRGPWLAGMTDGQFDEYLKKTVRPKRSAFRNFVKQHYAAELETEQRQKAAEEQREEPVAVRAQDITDKALTNYLRELRQQDRVTLFRLVSRFLDLAPVSNTSPAGFLYQLEELKPETRYEVKNDGPYAEAGPPMTHPSAGLSYLRTQSYMDNHPVYGPQASHAPVKARVILPKNGSGSYSPKLGVAGIVANTPEGESAFNIKGHSASRRLIPGVDNFDPEAEGGTKEYVEPMTAAIDPSGKIQLKLQDAAEIAVNVQKERVGEADAFQKAVEEVSAPAKSYYQTQFTKTRTPSSGSARIGSSISYGLSGGGRSL
ncbi:mitochondrial ribosomal protein subunit-domain-containing protein [Pseudomassariella vexata]|uniref:Mitochondrial ribosomal protein subunit-domain-containing protein n=1 Tax=Pseudomassariella vexata TaxID=1141098 RepID=A0A1Y2DV05_9PEZI|nr:mitochondrial ribosomal protein subunit-domain-containing protein [Pseudomassariella vexata]ORY63122.1 mitochondrial ribosomal protein subunit-domain-containing protein [Pseudomassariella vexata]